MTESPYDAEAQAEALHLLAARSPRVATQAAHALNSTSDAARQVRLDKLVPPALGDRDAGWTKEERALLAGAMRGGAPRMTDIVRVRCTPAEKAEITQRAEKAGMTVSDFVRARALGPASFTPMPRETTPTFSRNIDIESLRADWIDDPDLTPVMRKALEELPDAVLSEALEQSFSSVEDMWYVVIDSARAAATASLLRLLDEQGEKGGRT
jgi:hypothetical protein